MGKPERGKKIRTDFRKKHDGRVRKTDFTRDYRDADDFDEQMRDAERISGKGELTRKRTVIGEHGNEEAEGFQVRVDVDDGECRRGHVLSVHGLACRVLTVDGRKLRCAIRGVLKSMSTDLRHVVVAGDRVTVRPIGGDEGVIERVEPRYGMISRTSRGRQHLIVANVDQLLIVTSAAEPSIKPGLVDRLIVTAEKSSVRPVICINKVDLVDLAPMMPLVGVWSRMGYEVLLVSAVTGLGLDRLRTRVIGRQSVVAGQSGVGKSSLLNAIEPGLNLKVAAVSAENQKGRHTTTAARMVPMTHGGYVVDTPGIRQFQLWDVVPQEVCGYYRDLRCYVDRCRFPDCTHTHEDGCGVKDGVADNQIDLRRYESYVHLCRGDAV